MRTTTILLGAVIAVTAVATGGCGVDELGVRSVAFGLSPVPIESPPPELDAVVLVQIDASTATATVDVHEDSGMIMASGLPALPDTVRYVVMLQFADHDRAALPGGTADDGLGHAHGPLSSGPDDSPPLGAGDDDELTAALLGEMMPAADAGVWMAPFTSEEISSHSIGALRAAMIMLVPDTGASSIALFGTADEAQDEAAADGEGGGHNHGP